MLLADLDLTLVFANTTAMLTIRLIETGFHAAVGVGADDVVGGSIHRFHRSASHVEGVLHGQGTTFPRRDDLLRRDHPPHQDRPCPPGGWHPRRRQHRLGGRQRAASSSREVIAQQEI